MKCHLPRWPSAIVVYFFPTSFHDLFCPSLPAVSLVWNIFSSLHPTGFKIPVTPTDFWPEHNKPRAAFHSLIYISALGMFHLFPFWSFPSSSIHLIFEFNPGIWGFLFQYFMCHCSMFGAEWVPQSMNSLSSPLLFFSALGFHVWWLLSREGQFRLYGCSGISRCELITHHLPDGLVSCRIFNEIDG